MINVSNKVCVIGAFHRDKILKVVAHAFPYRSNPVVSSTQLGGVGLNIARSLWTGVNNGQFKFDIKFVTALSKFDEDLKKWLQDCGIESCFTQIDKPSPNYTAILDQNGKLLIGAADMRLYDSVEASDLISMLPANPMAVIFDANFPDRTMFEVVDNLPEETKLLAVGTSVQKVERFLPLLRRLDALVVNRSEAKKLENDHDNVVPLASSLVDRLTRSNSCVLVSDGAELAALACGNEVVSCRPPRIELTSENGAGDAMAAAFFQSFLRKCSGNSSFFSDSRELAGLLESVLRAGASYAAPEMKLRNA